MESCVVQTALFDFGRLIGVAVEYDGQRRTVKVENPFWLELDAAWKKAHPDG